MKSLPYKLPLICVAFFLLLSVPSLATTINITITADAYMSSAAPTTNYDVIDLSVYRAGATNRTTFFLIDAAVIPNGSTVNSARLFVNNKNTITPATTLYHTVYNTSLAWNETNLTYNSAPAKDKLIQNYTVINRTAGQWSNYNITSAIQSSVSQGKSSSIRIDWDLSSTGYGATYYSSESGTTPYVEVDFSASNDCNTSVIGTYCDVSDPSFRGIITTPDYTCLNDKYYTCPIGSRCTQITPQVNITTPLIENFTDCSKCFFVYTSNIWGLNPVLLYTNCPNNPECNPGPNSICLSGTNPVLFTCPGVFITPTDVVPASANYYTAGCFDPGLGWVPIVIDQNGNQTTINNLTITIFGNNTNLTSPVMNSCPNSTSSCYIVNNSVCVPVVCTPTSGAAPSDSINSAAGGLAGMFGSLFGIADVSVSLAVFSLFISIGVGIVLMYYTRNSAQGGNTFIFGTLAPLIMFAVMGWFPGWILILLLVAGAFLVAKSMGLGGG
jgi:hypothetical protein